MFGIDDSCNASLLLCLCDGMDREGSLTAGFRSVDLDDSSARVTTDSEGCIKCIDVESGASLSHCEYYTVDGVRLAAPARGITIVKNVMSNGKVSVSKVLVK